MLDRFVAQFHRLKYGVLFAVWDRETGAPVALASTMEAVRDEATRLNAEDDDD
jgi:hypothetical protein